MSDVIALRPVAPLTLDHDPGPVETWCRGLRASWGKAQGDLGGADALPEIVVHRKGVVVDAARVQAYEAVCDVNGHGALPPLMPQILFLGSMARLLCHPELPLSPLGVVHIRQQARILAPITPGQGLDLETRLAAARRTARGVELDVDTRVTRGGELVWEGTATLLSRNAATRSRAEAARPDATVREGVDVEAADDIGRRYARVSGDVNPHHLYPWTARPFGYRLPIAHGMWTMAFLLGFADPLQLAPPVRLDASFKRPLYLPGTLRVCVDDDQDPVLIEAVDPRKGAPHVRLLLHRTPQRSGTIAPMG